MNDRIDVVAREQGYWEAKEEFEWLTDESIRSLIAGVPVSGGVLELCAGSGMFTKRVWALHGSQVTRYVCVDISSRLLAKLQQHVPGVETLVGDAQRPIVEPQSFDHVLVFAGLHHLPDRESAYATAFGALRPGGHFFCFEPNSDCLYRKPMLAMRSILGLYTEDEVFLSPDETKNGLSAAGFIDVQIGFCTPRYEPRHLSSSLNLLLSRLIYAAARFGSGARSQSFFTLTARKP